VLRFAFYESQLRMGVLALFSPLSGQEKRSLLHHRRFFEAFSRSKLESLSRTRRQQEGIVGSPSLLPPDLQRRRRDPSPMCGRKIGAQLGHLKLRVR